MNLPKDFWTELPTKSDAELYGMLAHEGDYLPEAIVAAKEELAKRKLAPEQAAKLEVSAHSQKEAEGVRASERLGWPMRILIFFLCAGMGGAILAVYYDSRGYKTKATDCWITLVVSLLIHFVLGVIAYSI